MGREDRLVGLEVSELISSLNNNPDVMVSFWEFVDYLLHTEIKKRNERKGFQRII
ncbi:MAG: hypothetical protein J5785_06280 [Spirochaetales bacterium]|nr:hypothetical protein [Spirochaetales bacterium]